MDVEAEISRGTEGFLFLLSEKRSEAAFNDLLEYAVDACLVNPPTLLGEHDSSKYDQPTQEATLVQQIGPRALSTLLETKDGLHPSAGEHTKFHVSELITAPSSFSDTPNNRILENAERFGQALIDESFAVLGSDAPKWAEKLRNATTRDEELDVINWLDRRIFTISNRSRSESSAEDEQAHFYPPYRISPKFIGAYPKLDVQPSCLSVSIIATSFFEKAGKPTLHAGVTTPANEGGTNLLTNTIRLVGHHAKDSSYEGKHAQASKLFPLAKSGQDWTRRPLAQHSAVYAKLSDRWVQFDAYSNATTTLLGEESSQLDSLQEKLSDWKDITPNLEFSINPLPDFDMQLFSSEHAALTFMLATFNYEGHPELIEKIDSALKEIPSESYTSYLYETCLLPLLDLQYVELEHQEQEIVLKYTLEEAQTPKLMANGNYDVRMQRIFDTAIRDFMRWDATPEEFIERCTNDASYRARRVEDFLSVPSMMAVFNAQLIAQTDPGLAHIAVDVGNPAMRIGLATLSDFARYDSHPLPASFWITHWPGTVSILENLDNPPASKVDTTLLFNNLLWQQSHPFTSRHNYDKITSFLSDNREDLQDGGQQEGS